MVEIELTSLA